MDFESEALDHELDSVFNCCERDQFENVRVDNIVIACIEKYASGNNELKNWLTGIMDPMGSNPVISRLEFKNKLKEFILGSYGATFPKSSSRQGSREEVWHVSNPTKTTFDNRDPERAPTEAEDSLCPEEGRAAELRHVFTKKLKALKERNALLEMNLNNSDHKVQSLESKLKNLKRESHKKIEMYKEETKRMEALQSKLQQKCIDLEEKCRKLSTDYFKTEKDLDKLKDMERMYEVTKSNLFNAEQEVALKKYDLQNLEAVKENLQRELDETGRERDELSLEINKLKSEITQLLTNQEELLTKIDVLKVEKQELQIELSEARGPQDLQEFLEVALQTSLSDGEGATQDFLGLERRHSIQDELEECGYFTRRSSISDEAVSPDPAESPLELTHNSVLVQTQTLTESRIRSSANHFSRLRRLLFNFLQRLSKYVTSTAMEARDVSDQESHSSCSHTPTDSLIKTNNIPSTEASCTQNRRSPKSCCPLASDLHNVLAKKRRIFAIFSFLLVLALWLCIDGDFLLGFIQPPLVTHQTATYSQ